jgi:uncharacterized protein
MPNDQHQRTRNRHVVEAFLERLEAFDIDGFVALFDDTAVQLQPFAPPGMPARLEGRSAIRAQYQNLPENFASMHFVDRRVVDMADPNGFVVTFRGVIRRKDGGDYNNSYVCLFSVRDGRITEYVEHASGPRNIRPVWGL